MFTVSDAEKLAKECHSGQFRRDGITSYFEHCKAVASRVKDDDLKIIALLHDVKEDTPYSFEYLKSKGVPDKILFVLEILTHRQQESYKDYIDRIKKNPIATKVKIADILSNLADDPTERQIKKYARALLNLLSEFPFK